MSNLTPHDRRALEQQLQQRERELRDDIARESGKQEDYQRLAGEAPDPGDDSNADLIRDLNHAEVQRDVRELHQVLDALGRIRDAEGYGICIDCGADIPLARLKVEPSAVRCTPCQERFDGTHAEGQRAATL